ncbi:MAG: hypothetical protein E2O68_08745 [Deltaproteobacteria bacterium]|nr:MAG: hypothetical protein E2O68_08745 [Deltaproteobacteria bacterium]
MKKLMVFFFAFLMVMPTYAENYTPTQDAYQANDIPLDASIPFSELDDDEDPICPGEPLPDMDEDTAIQPPFPNPFPRRRSRVLCIAQGRRMGRRAPFYYALGRSRREASRRALRRCRRETFSRCRLWWCGRVNN